MIKTVAKIHKHISCVQRAIMNVAHRLERRAFFHDDSKFQSDELKGFARFDNMPEGLIYGSDEYKEAMSIIMKDNDCFDLHSKRNDHHPEYYVNVQLMPLLQVIEMVCDWHGAHRAYGNKGDWGESVRHNIGRYNFSEGQKWVIYEVSGLLTGEIDG